MSFWPPKPKLLDMRHVDFGVAGLVGDVIQIAFRVGVMRFIVGGSMLSRMASTQQINSTAPAAAIRWPIMLLMLLTGQLLGAARRRRF